MLITTVDSNNKARFPKDMYACCPRFFFPSVSHLLLFSPFCCRPFVKCVDPILIFFYSLSTCILRCNLLLCFDFTSCPSLLVLLRIFLKSFISVTSYLLVVLIVWSLVSDAQVRTGLTTPLHILVLVTLIGNGLLLIEIVVQSFEFKSNL